MYKCIHNMCPKNLSVEYKAYNCRPNDFLLLKTSTARTKYGKRRFGYYGPRAWNKLPLELRMEESIDKFKSQVKTLLFNSPETFMLI